MAAYHEAHLSELLAHVTAAVDGFRDGTLDVFDVDKALFQYSRAARDLWKFCNATDVDVTAGLIDDMPRIDRWDRGAPKKR